MVPGLGRAAARWLLAVAFVPNNRALTGNGEVADRIAEPDSEREGTPQSIDEVRPVVNAMLAHPNHALEGLSSADVRIARSQFRQFFTNWEDVGDELSGCGTRSRSSVWRRRSSGPKPPCCTRSPRTPSPRARRCWRCARAWPRSCATSTLKETRAP